MNLISKHLGFVKPYKMERVVLTIFAVLFSIVLLIEAFILPQFNLAEQIQPAFFIYIFGLIALSIVFLSKVKLSYILFVVAMIEFSIGNAPFVLNKILNANFPLLTSFTISNPDNRFEYHPMLVATPIPDFEVKGSSSRKDTLHTSTGLRATHALFDPQKPHIAVFGGSTTYDVGVSDKDTWVSLLNDKIENASISNNGVPGYSTAEHVVQTAFYVDKAGTVPKCAVYYIGWNDIRNSGFGSIDNGYADFHLLSQFTNLQIKPGYSVLPSPFFNLSYMIISDAIDWMPKPSKNGTIIQEPILPETLKSVLAQNVQSITAMNKARNIRTVFIGQLLNKDALTSDNIYGWLPYVQDKHIWPLQIRFNDLLRDLSRKHRASYIDINVEEFDSNDFVDQGHFSSSGADKFSNLIKNDIINSCGI